MHCLSVHSLHVIAQASLLPTRNTHLQPLPLQFYIVRTSTSTPPSHHVLDHSPPTSTSTSFPTRNQ
jgi:hypothetical protein